MNSKTTKSPGASSKANLE